MPHYIIVAITIFILVLLQLSFAPNILPWGGVADAALCAIIYWASRKGFSATWRRTVFAGFLVDLVGFYPIGVHMISFSLIAFGVGSLAKRFLVASRGWSLMVTLGLIVAGTLANMLAELILAELINGLHQASEYSHSPLFSLVNVYRILFNALMLMIIYNPLRWLENHLGQGNKNLPLTGKVFKST